MLIRLFRDPWTDAGVPLGPQIVTRWNGELERTEVEWLDYRQPLPSVALPLRPEDPEIVIPLQPLLDKIYDTGRYPIRVKYTRPPNPPLTDEQRRWAEGVLREKGLVA